jgi:HAD superfamily hydrolase (TIGR01509 family)
MILACYGNRMTLTAHTITLSNGPRFLGPLDAVLFDMDGLLIDTEPPWAAAERIIAGGKLGWKYTTRDHAQLIGVDLRTTVEYLRSAAPRKIRDATTVEEVTGWLLAELKYQVREYGVKTLPGARTLINEVRAAPGLKTAVVTSSPAPFMWPVLAKAGMVFDSYVNANTPDGETPVEPKPSPAPYLLAARLLDVDPARCLVLEDSITGVAAAVAAKIGYVVAVPSEYTRGQRITAADGCLVLRSLDGLHVTGGGLMVRAGYL